MYEVAIVGAGPAGATLARLIGAGAAPRRAGLPGTGASAGGADGANSMIRRWALPGHRLPAYLALQEWYSTDRALPYYTAIFDPEVTDFYAWTIPKGDHLLVGAAVPRDGARERFQLLKEKLRARGFEFGRLAKREGCLLLRPRGPRHLALGARNLALVGEAAGWISPSSAEGLSYAMRSALALARAMDAGLEGLVARYRAATRGLAANLTGKHAESLVMYDGRLRGLVLASGVSSARTVDRTGDSGRQNQH